SAAGTPSGTTIVQSRSAYAGVTAQMMGEPPTLPVPAVLHQTQQRRLRDQQPTAELLVVQPLDLLEHACSLEVEEGQSGVPLAAVVAGHPFPLRLEHGGRIAARPSRDTVGASPSLR